jgi:23S rRNA (uracil1939-C5)-methyltransferase
MPADLHEVTLTTLTYGGDALGRLEDGRAVFVPFGLPGERVRVRLAEEKRGFARGELIEVLDAAPERITPRCKHFFSLTPASLHLPPNSANLGGEKEGGGEELGVRFCGGCHYQHMSYEMQLKAKADILRDQLRRIGKIENPPVRAAVACPTPWNYRNHVQFHLTDEGKIGYAGAGFGSTAITPITECHLPEESVNSLWPQLQFDPGTDIQRVSLRAGADGEVMLLLESVSPETPEVEIEADISVAHVFEDDAVIVAGEDHITTRALNRDFRVSASSFFQVNTAMAGTMVGYILGHLPASPSTILDVYCGVGLFSAFLAPRCMQLIGIESSKSACEDFTYNLDEFNNVELYEDLAENVLPTLNVKPGLVLVDPPRAGLEGEALDAVMRLEPKTILYVSCDPSTLARDAARLIHGGYRLIEVTPFDLFPQTYHIESISIFEKA